MSILIKNGTIATSENIFLGDIYIDKDVVTRIGSFIDKKADKVIDATGKIVIPGGIDVHTHLNLHQGKFLVSDDFYTGTVAAACGGTTCIVDHMEFGPVGCNLKHQVDVYHGYADGKAVIDYSFHGVVQHVNDAILDEMESIIEDDGITSFKIYLTYNFKLDDDSVLRAMDRLRDLGAVTCIHCENDGILRYYKRKYLKEGLVSPIYHALSRPEEAESEAIERMATLSKLAGNAPIYIVHVSSVRAAEIIAKAKARHLNIRGETCPQYLFLDQEKYKEENYEGLKYIMSPPLREKFNQERMWDYVRDGTLGVIGTDHCPFKFKDKLVGLNDFSKCPNGIPGIETRIPLLFSEGVMKKRIDLPTFVRIISTNPARAMGLYPQKGDIRVGSDADIVIIDPNKKVTISSEMLHENVDYTCYEGFSLQGYPIQTLSRGEIIYDNGQFIGKKGRGEFIKRSKVNVGSHYWE